MSDLRCKCVRENFRLCCTQSSRQLYIQQQRLAIQDNQRCSVHSVQNKRIFICRAKNLKGWRQLLRMFSRPLLSKFSSLEETLLRTQIPTRCLSFDPIASPRISRTRRDNWSCRISKLCKLIYPKKKQYFQVSLGVGAYRTSEGKPWILPVVKKAEKILAEKVSSLMLGSKRKNVFGVVWVVLGTLRHVAGVA